MLNKLPISLLFLSLFLQACSHIPKEKRVAHDPWEGYNRAVFSFNSALDNNIVKPVARGYKAITPDPVENGVSNVFSNIDELPDMLNNLLQFKIKDSATSFGRFLINSTIGIYGIFDVASTIGLKEKEEDFGQTLGKWGVNNGPYFMLPFLGPSTLRDTAGVGVEIAIDPIREIEHDDTKAWTYALQFVDTRAGLLSATDFLDDAATDPYTFLRESYILQRQSVVNDGELVESSVEEDDLFGE